MATRRERCNGCNALLRTSTEAVTVLCPVCQTITRLQPIVDAAVVAYQPRPPRYGSINSGAHAAGQPPLQPQPQLWPRPAPDPPSAFEEEANPGMIPTKQNLRAALRWLVRDCQPGDSLLFHYSGHGSTQNDLNNDEVDGVDEVICPVDYETEGPIIDDEINSTIVTPLPPVLMNRKGYYAWEDQRTRASYKGTSGGLALSLSACNDHQTSASTNAFRNREVSSAMTTRFVHVA
ncbi:metacaspase 1 [Melia azedarach]|uniref:Metacaspase 1 n=1 Tax=Melia azedarach TaxID=155640 RepID=A0ACC1Y0H1_MELAZ|nr:metacaspase 1 [Melia azedarach]